ncbi:hypothetical protein PFISCL1PPCAC_18980, partial [Pristionchus fissidentatus]
FSMVFDSFSPPSKRPRRFIHFPLLDLPNEILSHIFSFLPIQYRLRARVNKRLDRIELESKYDIKKLRFKEKNESRIDDQPYSPFDVTLIVPNRKSNFAVTLKRVVQTAKLHNIYSSLSDLTEYHREIYHILYNLPLNLISVFSPDFTMDDQSLLESARIHKSIEFSTGTTAVTENALRSIALDLETGRIPLKYINLSMIDIGVMQRFLASIGITRIGLTIFSKKAGVEIFEVPVVNSLNQY